MVYHASGMNSLSKFIASVAALVASLALVSLAFHGLKISHVTDHMLIDVVNKPYSGF
jgi:hypothetical protein